LQVWVACALAGAPVIPAEVQASIRSRVDFAYNPGIVVGMVNADGRAFFSYGQTAYDSGVLPDEHSLYEIGSVTKVFTATLLAELVAQGEAQLADPVASLLPGSVMVPARSGIPISLEHLATHSSGLPANPPLGNADPVNPFAGYSEEDLHDFLATYVLPRDPGSAFEYSNLGAGLLGHALAHRLQLTYEEALRARILLPLGLADTAITLTPDQAARRVPGYSGVVPRPPFQMASLSGAGMLRSTVDDLLTFLEYQLGLRPTTLASVLQATQAGRFPTPDPSLWFGLGWQVISSGPIQLIMHDGATMGQTAFVAFNPQTGTGVVVLTNVRANEYANISDIGLKLLVPQVPLTPIVPPATVPLATLRSHVGRYQAADGTWFDIGLLRGLLTVAYSEDRGATFSLYPESSRRFRLLDIGVNGTADFQTNVAGQATAMAWTQPGYQDTFVKQTLPLQLALERAGDTVQLTLSGNTDTDYVVETSDDLTQWIAIATNTIWDGPILEGFEPGVTRRFYQARGPSGPVPSAPMVSGRFPHQERPCWYESVLMPLPLRLGE
jgi:CubicO group peptidase (beta-lactamase class C family)